jgi:pyridoxine 4-dehydrogenase
MMLNRDYRDGHQKERRRNTMAAAATVTKTFKLGGELEIHRLGYGAMRITGKGIWGEPADRENAQKVLRRAVELGVDFIDTADSYGPAVSEPLIGEALAPYAKNTVIATKAGLTRQGPDKWLPVGRPEYLTQQVEMSLRWLKRDRLDLWQLHRVDAKVPVEDSLGAIKKLQTAGKIRFIGLSEVTVAQIEQARKVVNIVSVQNEYNLGNRKSEAVVEYCEREGIAFIPCRQTGATRWQAGRTREKAWGDGFAVVTGMAAAALTCDAADTWNIVGGAPGGESGGRECDAERSRNAGFGDGC